MNIDKTWIKDNLLERFLRYVKIDTMSNRHNSEIPSTPGQWDLIRLLEKEVAGLGASEVEVDDHGYLIARFSARGGLDKSPTIGFLAHVDTSADMPGANVKPRIVEDYDLSPIPLNDEYVLDPADYPRLLEHKGDSIIVTDGTTLLGADDKAGIAEIMTAMAWLQAHPEIPHGPLEVVFTPDEETGKGLAAFPAEKLKSRCCYTFDGDVEGSIEGECFNAWKVELTFTGYVIHLGSARGKLVNAVSMAASFINMLPRNESPEGTDGRFGYYTALEIKGGLDEVKVEVFLRDFETSEIERRIEAIRSFAKAVEAGYPGGSVKVDPVEQYKNMREYIQEDPAVMECLSNAIRDTGIEPMQKIIRGGTDGARLCERGIPTPNVFTGGQNYHSRYEWASVNAMIRASHTVLNLIEQWSSR